MIFKPIARRSANVLILLALQLGAVTIPTGTTIQARLTTEVSSNSPSNQSIVARVVAPVLVNAVPLIPRGASIEGTTSDVIAALLKTETQEEKSARVRLRFTEITAAGHRQALSAIVESIDNARETVDDAGLITGIKASDTYTSMLDQGIGKLSGRYSDFAQILADVKGSIVKPVDPAIDFKPGTDLVLKLTKPLNWTSAPVQDDVPGVQPVDLLNRLVAVQPLRTVAQNPPSPSDLTNLMFIGEQTKLEDVFKAAGWFPADPLGRSARLETARAIIEDRGYNEAPVSILYLDRRPPDLVFQKQTNTFAMRHHIRVWRRPETFQGRPVWMAAATHDIKIYFSHESRSFTHGIDSHIDSERAKVVNDFVFTGQTIGFSLIDRPNLPPDPSNATGDKLITDGKLAVIELR